MKKILTSTIIIFTVLNIYATEIDGINYNLDDVTLTASVISKTPKYTGNVVLPSSVAYNGRNYVVSIIDVDAFSSCYTLDTVTLPPQLEYIKGRAFESSGLKYIRIPGGVIEIEGMAFVNCSELDSIDFEEGITTIGNYAFANCTKIKNITLPSSVTNMNPAIFQGCTNLVSAKIFGSIQFLPEFTFKDCANLKYFDVPESVQSIGERVFENCISMDSITIHEGLINIDQLGCENLRNITLPSTLLHMYSSLGICSKIEYIRSYAVNPPYCYGSCFTNVDKSIPVYVPTGSGHLYRSANPWKYFSNIIEEGTPTGFNPINTSNRDNKFINNGQIYIFRGDKTYTITGTEVK